MNSIEFGGSDNTMHLNEQMTYMCKCRTAIYSSKLAINFKI